MNVRGVAISLMWLVGCGVTVAAGDDTASTAGWEVPPRLWNNPITEGSGTVITVERATTPFAQVEIRVPFRVRLVAGAATGVTVTVDDNLQERIDCRVADETLVIEAARGSRSASAGLVEITVPSLRSLATYGPSECQVTGLSGPTITVHQYGRGLVTLAGAIDSLTVESYGAGNIDATDLRSDITVVGVYGCGDVTVSPIRRLAAAIYGAGNVVCLGDPAERSLHDHGSGRVSFP